MNKCWFYGRVSSRGQNLDRQIALFKEMGAEDRDIITEKISGKTVSYTHLDVYKRQVLLMSELDF